MYSEAAGIARIFPIGVAVPFGTDDVVTLVQWAADRGVPLVPRGSGSSMGGGAIGSGVVVDLGRLRTIGEVDVERRTVRAGPGALRADIDRCARECGLRFPVDPSSSAFCTIGGMAATNAAGARSLAFGSTRRWVRALDCVFDDATHAEIRRGNQLPREVAALERFARDVQPVIASHMDEVQSWHRNVRKDSSGYAVAPYARSGELTDLLAGSEGTLAFFVEVELDLVPVARATSGILGAFASLEDAMSAAVQAHGAGAVACELLERTFLDMAAGGGHALPVAADSAAVLLTEIEAASQAEAAEAARVIEKLFKGAGATTVQLALDDATQRELWELRHAASPMLARLDASLASMQFIEDGAVPPERLPAYVDGVREALQRQRMRGVIFGHAGDAHVHVNPLVPISEADWRRRVDGLLHDVVALTASLSGTLTGEHGDGRLRTPLLGAVWPDRALDLFAAVKRAFDPRGVFNPGVKVPLPGQRAVMDIKYDPDLPPLPASAARALDYVARERAYDLFRLDLLDG